MIFTQVRISRDKFFTLILSANVVSILHTLAVISNRMQSMFCVSLVLYPVNESPMKSQSKSVCVLLGPVPRLLSLNPSVLYGKNLWYKPSDLISSQQNVVRSKPVKMMSACSGPISNITGHADMDCICIYMRVILHLPLNHHRRWDFAKKLDAFGPSAVISTQAELYLSCGLAWGLFHLEETHFTEERLEQIMCLKVLAPGGKFFSLSTYIKMSHVVQEKPYSACPGRHTAWLILIYYYFR